MRLTTILLTVVCVNVSAHSYEQQTVSFSGKDVPLTSVFKSIERQTGLSFFFNYSVIKDARPVTLDMQNVQLDELLNSVLKTQGLDYYKQGKTVFIVKGNVNKPVSDVAEIAPEINVRGKVLNSDGLPLPGATVMVKNKAKGVVTDAHGAFELKNVPEGAMLEISYTGYQRKDVPVGGDQPIVVELSLATNILDETQVIAYGSTTQRFTAGNISTVKSEEISRQPVDNILPALEGRVPGLFITQTNGLPGGGVTVRIQGQNSIGNGNDPLYVIDGMPYVSQMLATTTGGTSNVLGTSGGPSGSGFGNPLNYINPSDIESVEVLKDADATAIYGSRAANGAILITTKKGKVGKSKVDMDLQTGLSTLGRHVHLMHDQQYLEMRREALVNDGIAKPSATDYDINGLWDTTGNTNWQKKLLGKTSEYTNLYGSVSGGTVNTQYLIAGTYRRQTSVFPSNFNDQKGGLHFSLDNLSEDQKFRVRLSGSYLVDDNHLPGVDLTTTALTLAPDAPALYTSNGALNWMPNAAGTSSWTNPLSTLQVTYQNKTNNLIGNATLEYHLLRGLTIQGNLGYTNLLTNELQLVPLTAVAPESRLAFVRRAYYTNSTINSWLAEPQIDYKNALGKGKLDLLVGATIQHYNNSGEYLNGTGYNSDAVMADIHSAANVTVTSSVASVYKYDALYGRLNYVLADKYILDGTLRRDGSSRFGSNNQFHDFWSVGAGWIFSQESVIRDHFRFLSFGKIRGSYGTTGNDQIGDYKFLDLYNATGASVPYQNATGLTVQRIPNPYLQWEETKKLQVGVNLGLLKDRILLAATYAYNRSTNELLPYALPVITGFFSIIENFPATIQNTDWEFTLNTINIKSRKFTWNTSANLAIPQNKLVAFPNLASSSYSSSLIIGKPITITRVYHSLGVNPTTGAYWFSSAKGTPTSTPSPSTDYAGYVNTKPVFYGGFENQITYCGLQLDVMLQFVKQTGPSYSYGATVLPGYPKINQPATVFGRWTHPGELTGVQRFNSNNSLGGTYAAFRASDAYFQDNSFIRLKNVALSYLFPARWQKSAHLGDLRVFVLGENLFTVTRYKGLDAESLSAVLPPLRTVTVGLHVTL